MPQSNHYSHQSRSHNDRRRQQPDEKVQATVNISQRFPLTIQRLGINGEGIGGSVAKFENQTRPL